MSVERWRVLLTGAVQGVGFRPFVYRLATELQLGGWVRNSSTGLEADVEGSADACEEFLRRLEEEKPAPAVVLTREISRLAPAGERGFRILSSDPGVEKTAAVLPDLATCGECLAELRDPANRRYRYPFTNCTNCGPRFTIVLDIPYDRPNTTMREFALCEDCRREYHDPRDRRFHAQPNACPVCGPRLDMGIAAAAAALGRGEILALKGIGGFQLLVDARDAAAVARLRARKRREEKPLAVMMASLDEVRRYCHVSEREAALLASSAAPIVLLRPLPAADIAPGVPKGSPYLGVMLPCSPLHHLLLEACGFPVVATSGNASDEPIAIGNEEARERLGGIADCFLTHNRPIARHADDSVARVSRGRVSLVRRARGYAPLPVPAPRPLPPVLAVGAHLKNTVAIAVGPQVFLSQHIGDLDTLEARRAFERAIEDLCRLYQFRPEAVVCDLHPDYASTLWARTSGLPVTAVQHHMAHASACAAENDVREPFLAVSWDGTGYGLDGTIWGGEIFLVDGPRYDRVSWLRPFPLPGGEAAVKQGWRAAAALLDTMGLPPAGWPHEPTVRAMLARKVNCPLTSSVGRLFDAAAALTGVARESRFEGQAAMLFEAAIGGVEVEDAYPLPAPAETADWAPLVDALLGDAQAGAPKAVMAARFHNALVEWIAAAAARTGVKHATLSGGVFQNTYLTERAAARLEAMGIAAHTHQRVPANDGGIALGQAVLAASSSP